MNRTILSLVEGTLKPDWSPSQQVMWTLEWREESPLPPVEEKPEGDS